MFFFFNGRKDDVIKNEIDLYDVMIFINDYINSSILGILNNSFIICIN